MSMRSGGRELMKSVNSRAGTVVAPSPPPWLRWGH
jgi:hypothetical protein